MKKVIVFFAILSVFASLHSKPAQPPEWIIDCNKVFPRSEYIAMLGTGTTGENAKSDATGNLSRYFSSNVKVKIDASRNFNEQNGSTQRNSTLNTNVHTESNIEIFGIEFTEPYFLKKEKIWYAVAFINRSDAWRNYKPQIDVCKNEFSGLYNKLIREKDAFLRIKSFRKLRESGNLLLEKLEYARLINPVEEAAYQTDRDNVSSIEVLAEEALSNCSIFLQVTGSDYKKSINTAVAKAFSENSFIISKTESDANYVADIQIENNENGSEPMSINPAISLKVINKAGKSVFSHEIISSEKALGYTLEAAQRKIFPELSSKFEKEIKDELAKVMN